MKTFKEFKPDDYEYIEEAGGVPQAGWMLKQDPELKKKVDANLKINKARKAAYGNPSAGFNKPVKEETDIMSEGVTSPEIQQAYKDIFKTAPSTLERKNAVAKYSKLRKVALANKRSSVKEESNNLIDEASTLSGATDPNRVRAAFDDKFSLGSTKFGASILKSLIKSNINKMKTSKKPNLPGEIEESRGHKVLATALKRMATRKAVASGEIKPGTDSDDVPFDNDHETGVKKDQYGNVVKNRAKYLAKQGMHSVKEENMLTYTEFMAKLEENSLVESNFKSLSKPVEVKHQTNSKGTTWEYKTSQDHVGKKVGVVSGPPPQYGSVKPTDKNTRKGKIVKSYMVSGGHYHIIKFDDGKTEDHPHHNVYHMDGHGLREGKYDDLKDKLAADRENRLSNYDFSKEKEKSKSNVTKHYAKSPEEREDDEAEQRPEKRGRGRPAGTKSGARR